jgi:hypothetical protein
VLFREHLRTACAIQKTRLLIKAVRLRRWSAFNSCENEALHGKLERVTFLQRRTTLIFNSTRFRRFLIYDTCIFTAANYTESAKLNFALALELRL